MFFDDGLPQLPEEGCEALLASCHVGRMSVTVGALPLILPVTYQCIGGKVIIGMHQGPALRGLARETVVALGIDNADSTAATWAVLVIGRAIEVTDPTDRNEFQVLEVASLPCDIPHSQYVRLRLDHISGYHTTMP